MNVIELGKENSESIILIHGGGLSWWNYQEVAKLLENEYHVILPIIDGHAGSDADFVSIEHYANKVIDYIDTHLQHRVYVLAGVSLGAQIVVDILSKKEDICECAIVESALVKPNKWLAKMIQPMLDMSYGLLQKTWFAKLQSKYLKIKDALYDAYYRDTCLITKDNMIAFMSANMLFDVSDEISNTKAKVYIVVGGKEPGMMKQSAYKLHDKLKDSVCIIKSNLHHGEFSLNHATEYCELVNSLKGE